MLELLLQHFCPLLTTARIDVDAALVLVHKSILPQLLLEEGQHPLPAIFGGGGIRRLGLAPPVEERVRRIRVDFDVMRNVVGIERRVQFSARPGCEIAFWVRGDDWAHPANRFQRTRIHGIKRRDRFQALVSGCPRNRKAAAEAKSRRS